MKIYIVFPGPLFPIVGMSQVRMLNQLKSLNRKGHKVVFSDILYKAESLKLAKQYFVGLDIEYEPVFLPRYSKGRAYRFLDSLAKRIFYELRTVTRQELTVGSKSVLDQILDIAGSGGVEAIMLHYWYLGSVFSSLDRRILRMIDTHYLVEEHLELMAENKYDESGRAALKHKRELDYSLNKQRSFFLKTDLVIANSVKQAKLIHMWDKRIPVNVTINGQDLSGLLGYSRNAFSGKDVCFYGALNNQFNRRALLRILTNIFPLIKTEIPDAKLYVIGDNPPRDILSNISDESVIVTGFVDDIRPVISKCRLLLLPLDTGSGFRGRAVEVMALGIPIIGTHNALQSIGFADGEHGYMVETDKETAQRAVELLRDVSFWETLSNNCRSFAAENFTLEATFDRLSDYIGTINSPQRVME